MSTAKTKKTVKTAEPSAPRKKVRALKKAPAMRTASETEEAPRRPKPSTKVGWVASVLPGTVRDARYVARTVEILDERERKAERLNEKAMKDLAEVVEDLKGDLKKRIETEKVDAEKKVVEIRHRAEETRFGRRIHRARASLDRKIDAWLDRLGLIRKSRLELGA